jgi:hypothetical protein
MSRLPQVDGDEGRWGAILNDFLNQAHDVDGNLNSNVVGTAQIQNGAVTAAKFSSGTGSAGQFLSTDGSSLTWSTMTSSGSVSNATSSSPGLVQLSGDLSGNATAPTVAKVNGIAVTGTPASGNVLTATSSSAASWSTPASAPVTSVAGRTGTIVLAKADVNLANVDNTSDASKPVSTATQTALNAKAPLASPTFTGTVTVPATPVNGTDATSKTYVDAQVSAGVADATTSAKGKVQLAGDLGGNAGAPSVLSGNATAPTVAKVNGIAVTGTPASGNVLTATSSTAASWSAPSGGGGGSLAVQNQGTNVTTAASSINFAGAGVTTTNSGNAVTVTIPGGSGGGSGFPQWTFVTRTPSGPGTTYNANAGECVLVNAATAGMTIVLPAPVANTYVMVKKTDATNNSVAIAGPSGTSVDPNVPGTDSLNGTGGAGQYFSDGTNWYTQSWYIY